MAWNVFTFDNFGVESYATAVLLPSTRKILFYFSVMYCRHTYCVYNRMLQSYDLSFIPRWFTVTLFVEITPYSQITSLLSESRLYFWISNITPQ
jgi:hypothetical protein